MTTLSFAYRDGAENDLTPLGERRRRLPLQRKVKQLERPWKAVDKRVNVVKPPTPKWASSQQRSKEEPLPGARLRSASARRRPSTGPSSPSLHLRRPRTWSNQPSRSSLVDPPWDESDIVGWVDTGNSSRGSRGSRRKQAPLVAVHGCAYILGPSGGEGSGHAEPVRSEPSGHTFADATLASVVSSPSCFAVGSAVNVDGRGEFDDNIKTRNIKNSNDEEGSYNNKSNVSLGSTDPFGQIGAGVCAVAQRPSSAGVSTARDTPFHPPNGDKAIRPQSSGPSSQGREQDCTVSGEAGCPLNSNRPPLEKAGYSVTSWPSEAGHDAKSLVEGRASVSVVLPMLEEANDAGDKRFWPGSAVKNSSRGESEADRGHSSQHLGSAQSSSTAVQTSGDRAINSAGSQPSRTYGDSSTLLRSPAPLIGALGYFVEDVRRPVTPSGAALHGRALVGSHHPRPRSSKRPLPLPPAVTPGEQPYGDTHPLSPTSMGSPPRRHRNSNWGEEGVPQAEEEVQNSRRTVPFVVSGTMLGWKLSTRERKKSLEESLKNSDYSEHHLIPVYGFRPSNGDANEREAGRGEGTGGGGLVGAEERRIELRRLEARALAAERASLERRARAEGGAGGAAFARAMCRRATARAEWIQKMGDVHDVRKENVCRGSSPENVCAYRKRVRDRLHGERLRQRAARGLPSRQPPRKSAVTSRADLPPAAAQLKKPLATDCVNGEGPWGNSRVGGAGHAADSSGSQGCGDEPCWREPYLMFVKAKTGCSQAGKTTRGMRGGVGIVPFCSECLGCCQGTCSPGGTPEMERTKESNGGGEQTTSLAHHEQPSAEGRTSPKSPQQQPIIQVVLPREANGVGGLSNAAPDTDEWR